MIDGTDLQLIKVGLNRADSWITDDEWTGLPMALATCSECGEGRMVAPPSRDIGAYTCSRCGHTTTWQDFYPEYTEGLGVSRAGYMGYYSTEGFNDNDELVGTTTDDEDF